MRSFVHLCRDRIAVVCAVAAMGSASACFGIVGAIDDGAAVSSNDAAAASDGAANGGNGGNGANDAGDNSDARLEPDATIISPPAGGSNGQFTISGKVVGLTAGESVTLLENEADSLKLTADGTFTMPAPFPSGTPYEITVELSSGPNFVTSYVCAVSAGGAGTIASANVTDVVVTCLSSCILFEGCVDLENELTIANGQLVETTADTSAPIGAHGGDCPIYRSQSGVDLYNAQGVIVVNGAAYVGADPRPAVSISTPGHYALVKPSLAVGDLPAISNGELTTSRGSVSLQVGGILDLNDVPASGAAYYELYICE